MLVSRTESNALKGIAIICIVLHNVLHILLPVTENEFDFSSEKVSLFLSDFSSKPISDLFSFYGWVGVSVFIFVSGYGLAVSDRSAGFMAECRRLFRRYAKLFMLSLPTYLAFLIIDRHNEIAQVFQDGLWLSFLAQQLMVLNFIDPVAIDPGAYWYLGLAIQLYVCFYLLRALPSGALWCVAVVSWLAVTLAPDQSVFFLRHNFIGWLPEFTLGILFARPSSDIFGRHRIPIALAALALMVAFPLWRPTFTLAGPAFVIFILAFRRALASSHIIIYIGAISAAIFVIHPVARALATILNDHLARPANPLLLAIGVLIVSVACAAAYSPILSRLLRRMNLA